MLDLQVLFMFRALVERLHVLECHPAHVNFKDCEVGACRVLQRLEQNKL